MKSRFGVFTAAVLVCASLLACSPSPQQAGPIVTADAATDRACHQLAKAANEATNAAWSYEAWKILYPDLYPNENPPVNLTPIINRKGLMEVALRNAPTSMRGNFQATTASLPDVSSLKDTGRRSFNMLVSADPVEYTTKLDIALKACVAAGVPLDRWQWREGKLMPVT